ncbi:MAG: nitroreductase family protein [Oscillospiraceae bacterium]
MNLTEIMKKRKSVRRYSGDAIPPETLDKSLFAGTLAPTSRNLKPCQFHLIQGLTNYVKHDIIKVKSIYIYDNICLGFRKRLPFVKQ